MGVGVGVLLPLMEEMCVSESERERERESLLMLKVQEITQAGGQLTFFLHT